MKAAGSEEGITIELDNHISLTLSDAQGEELRDILAVRYGLPSWGMRAPNPRTWAKAEDIPQGVKFKGVGEACWYVWQRSEDLRYCISTTPTHGSASDLAEMDEIHPDGFVEVLS